MRQITSVNPFRCKMWDMHDRLAAELVDSAGPELESFSKHGQVVPVLARPLRGDPDYDVELIYGSRRLHWARHTNRPLLIEVRELSDREAIVAMDIENRHRKDISPYERGMSFARWLRSGQFESQEELAKTLKISASQVSRLLKLARLPSVVVNAFPSAAQIREGWGADLLDVLEDKSRRDCIIARARVLGARIPRSAAEVVYAELTKAKGSKSTARRARHDEVVTDGAGKPLFRIRWQRRSLSVVVPIDRLREGIISRIRDRLREVLDDDPLGICTETPQGRPGGFWDKRPKVEQPAREVRAALHEDAGR